MLAGLLLISPPDCKEATSTSRCIAPTILLIIIVIQIRRRALGMCIMQWQAVNCRLAGPLDIACHLLLAYQAAWCDTQCP